jgi:hypothetical protein
MKILFVSMIIGIFAGIIDIVPMIVKNIDRKSIISAFVQYFFVSIVIVNIDLPGIPWWLQGSIISLALALPVIIIVSNNDMKAVPVITVMSIILGALIGIAGHLFK